MIRLKKSNAKRRFFEGEQYLTGNRFLCSKRNFTFTPILESYPNEKLCTLDPIRHRDGRLFSLRIP